MLIVFDWDGTLVDSCDHIVSALRSAAKECQLPVLEASKIKRIIGLGLSEAFLVLYPDISDIDKARLTKSYRVHFLEKDSMSCLFPGVKNFLQLLLDGGHCLAIATGKGRAGLDRQVAKFSLSSYFDFSRCADETASKPDPRMLHELIKESGFCYGDALMVGDTTYDLEMANNAGIKSVGVSYGVHEKNELVLCNPLQVVDSLEEIVNCI